ncbi:MAG: glycosyltransferase, partial [Proteobacteria bacterium]|nr:glycosyltransferase [Pseudomonadota bacterium]
MLATKDFLSSDMNAVPADSLSCGRTISLLLKASLVPPGAHCRGGVCAITPLARQFTLEYSALFDGLLPALERLRLPIPLGGTSNHFRLDVLRRVGAWDPYNVTEDADLGIRLARFGYRTRIIASTTWEEAPIAPRIWLGQRTRWLKGWVQTWLVHMRHPLRLLRDLGPWQFVGLQTLMSGIMLSVIIYPPFLALAAWGWATGELWRQPDTLVEAWLHDLALAIFVGGMAAPAVTAIAAVLRRR